VNAPQKIRSIDCTELDSKRDPTFCAERTPKLQRLFNACVVAVCGWAVIEAPLELGGAFDSTRLLALIVSKLLMGLVGAAAISNLRFAARVFAFVCAASVFAIAPALPLEYARSVPLALLSTIECLCKGACVASLVIISLKRGNLGWRSRSINDRQ
jgi:hypothetical protein